MSSIGRSSLFAALYRRPSPFSPLRFVPRFHHRLWVRAMASHVVGYPRIGPKRELKFALESFWDGKSSAENLRKVAKDTRSSTWKQMAEAPIFRILTHMCYSNFNDIIDAIIDMDADVISIENSRSNEKLLSVFHKGVKYGAGIGPGVYDIHSPRVPASDEIVERINKMLAVLDKNILWINPDCGLKTRKYSEVVPALTNMVAAAKLLRSQLGRRGSLIMSRW